MNRKFAAAIFFLTFLSFKIPGVWGGAVLGDLSGSVVDKKTGQPVADVTVTATGNGSSFVSITDESGYFVFVDLEPGIYKLSLERAGYKTAVISDIPVTSNSTSFQTYALSTEIYQVEGVKVTGFRNQTVSPRETMTYYGISKHDLDDLFPGPASLNINTLLQELPGVQTYAGGGGYGLGMPAGPHVRGGSGLGTVYAVDGIPLNNITLFGDPGNLGLTTGLASLQFYPGVYPVQYGNGMDGYQNVVVPEGSGPLHGTFQFSSGFWLDPGENSPTFAANPATGTIGNVVGTSNIRPANPNNWNLELEGQVGKFHYFFDTFGQDGGLSGYADPAAEAAITYSGSGGEVYRKVARDGLLKLNYDFDNSNSVELLLASGFDSTSPEFEFFISDGKKADLEPVPPFNYQFYDIESLEYIHHFSPNTALDFRAWLYNSNPDFNSPSVANGYFLQNDTARQKGVRLEFEKQINPENRITVGGQYIYVVDDSEMTPVPPNPLFALTGNTLFAGANNQNSSAWLNEEWTPLPKLDINAGVRWDKMVYQTPAVPGILTQSNGLPFADEGVSGFSPDYQINNPNDSQGMFTNCTPQLNICASPGVLSPSFVQPRISASYRITDNFTAKAGFGGFNTFADDQFVLAASNLCSPRTGLVFGVQCQVIGNVAYTTAGNLPESGKQVELSFEYLPNSQSFIKVTPYYKKVDNPLVYTFVPLAETGGAINAGSLTSKGIEVQIHTREWHGVTGTLNCTYNDSTITGNPEYAFLLLPQLILTNTVTGAGVIQPNVLSNSSTLYNQAVSASVPADWDIRHTVHLLLDYKPDKKWEIAPNFTFASGQPYGLGASQLQSLSANLQAACAALPNLNDPFLNQATCLQDLSPNGNPNPTKETMANSLRGPDFFLANLAVTYHATQQLSTTLSIFNLFNNSQILAYNSTPYFSTFMSSLGYPFAQDYSPLRGRYAPNAVQPIREYYLTTTIKF